MEKTLRDEFAMAAMKSFILANTFNKAGQRAAEVLAESSYAVADEMLAEKARETNEKE